MKKIYMVGSLSTGKTTLINEVTQALKEKGFRVGIIRDPAWDFTENFGVMENLADQFLILDTWKEELRKFRRKKLDFLFCDGAPFLSLVYSFLYEPNISDQRVYTKFQWIKEKIWRDVRKEMGAIPYLRFKEKSIDFVFFLPVEFPPVSGEGRRYYEKQEEISLRIRAFLQTYFWQDPRLHIIRGSVEERVEDVLGVIL